MTAASYKPYIDGLRAVSIVGVVAFHSGVPFVPGGFAGVDVFFVISGYLITKLLLDDVETTHSIDFVAFYARRVRRLLPTLMVVLAATLILAGLVLSPLQREIQEVARAALATLLLASNVYFAWWLEDYFAGPADFQPLLHMWSLSVEEQFYLVWPMIILLAARFCWWRELSLRPTLWTVFLFLSALSFTACWAIEDTKPAAAFFWMPLRAWELGAGALLAAYLPNLHRWPALAHTASAGGLAMIFLAFAIGRSGPLFPAPIGLLPVIGTVLTILGGAFIGDTGVSRLLSNKVMVKTGKLSYAWYLWHFPLIAIARLVFLEASIARDLGLSFVALGLSALTVRVVEDPLRFKILPKVRNAFVLAGAAACTIVGIGAAASLGLWAQRIAMTRGASEEIATTPREERAVAQPDTVVRGASLLVYGDSHAGHLLPGLAEWARKADNAVSIIPVSRGACPPVTNVVPLIAGYRKPECERANAEAMDDLGVMTASSNPAAGKPVAVVLAARWTAYLGASNISVYEPWRGYVDYRAGDSRAAEEILASRLQLLIGEFSRRSVRTVIVLSPPELRFHLGKCLERLTAERCATARATHDKHTATIRRIFSKLQSEFPNDVRVFDPTPLFCGPVSCDVTSGGKRLYVDSNHVSKLGSQIIADALAPLLQWALQTGSARSETVIRER